MAVAAGLAARRNPPPPVRAAQATTTTMSTGPERSPLAPSSEQPAVAKGPSVPAANAVAGIGSAHAPASEHRLRHVAAPIASAGPPVQRDVKFEVMPKGALVSIDGAPAEELFMKIKRLTVGLHVVEARVPDSKCCEPVRREEEIKPEDGSGTAQQISLSLRFRDALISAPDAPPGAQLSCPILGIIGPASARFPVHMSTFEQDISCYVDLRGAPSQRSSVTLRAGELVTITWSAPQAEAGVGGT
jgi:hypothetical protein